MKDHSGVDDAQCSHHEGIFGLDGVDFDLLSSLVMIETTFSSSYCSLW